MKVEFEEGRALFLTFVKKKKTIYYFDCYMYDTIINNSAFIGIALYNKKNNRFYCPQFPISNSSAKSEEFEKQVVDIMQKSVESLDYVFENVNI